MTPHQTARDQCRMSPPTTFLPARPIVGSVASGNDQYYDAAVRGSGDQGGPSTHWVMVGAISTAVLAIIGVLSLVFGPQIFGSGRSSTPPAGSTVGAGSGPTSPTESTSPALASFPAYLDTLTPTGNQPKTGVAYVSGRQFKESLYYVAAHGVGGPGSGSVLASHYVLGERYGHFSAVIGLGDEPGYQVEFEVIVDGHRLVDELIPDGATAVPISAVITGGQDLELTTTLRDVIAYPNDTTMIWGDAKIGP